MKTKMIIINKKLELSNFLLFNYEKFATPKDVFKENFNLKRMQYMKKQSHKRMTFVDGKNRQENARLKNINNLIEKELMFQDMNWFKDYIELKNSLKEIKSTTSIRDSGTFSRSTSPSSIRKLPSRSQLSSNMVARKQTPHSAPSEFSMNKTDTIENETDLDYLDYFKKKKKEKKQKSVRTNLTKTASVGSSKTYTIGRFDDVSSIKLNTNYLIRKRKADESDEEETKIRNENKLFSFKNLENLIEKNSNLQSNSYSTHTDLHQKCNIFPCALLKSYTSMIGPENDLAESQLKNVGFKSVHQTDNVNRVTISRLTRGTEETEFTDEKSTDKSPGNEDETEFMKTIVDDLVANKSIRRPLRNMNSAKDFGAKVRSLEAKVKYCQDQNKINFKKSDRNIRYGDPLPKNNIYRQLRIISQFDS